MQTIKPVKKLIIQDFKGQRLPKDFEDSSWSTLEDGLQAIFSGHTESISLESLYRTCESLCRCRLASSLYSKLKDKCANYAQEFGPRIQSIFENGYKDVEILKSLDLLWSEYTTSIRIVCNAFLYLDRVYVMNRPELRSIWEFCMLHFSVYAMGQPCSSPHMGGSPSIRQGLLKALLMAVEHDRRSEMSEYGVLLSNIFSMLTDLKLMDEWIISDFQEATTLFFADKATEKIKTLPIPQYLIYIKKRIDNELVRYESYGFDKVFSITLINIVRNKLFVDKIDEILRGGLSQMINTSDFDNLRILYDLSNDTSTMEIFRQSWLSLVRDTGISMILEPSKDELVIGELIENKDKLELILRESLSNNTFFVSALKEAFESIMNGRQNRAVELLSRYTDLQLRGGGPNGPVTEEQLTNIVFAKIISLFRFIQGKDLFETFFKKDLSKRLLLSRSISIEAEKTFVLMLKQECGSAFTSRLEGMFKDIELSKEEMASYNQKRKDSGKNEFGATIVTSGLWPYPPLINIKIPDFVVNEQTSFENYYKGQHKGRILTWHQSLGHVIFRAHFPLGMKELQVSIPQAIILSLFNDQESLSYREVSEKTGLDENSLNRTLQSLSTGKTNILNKLPKGKDISSTDRFSFNNEFTSKHQKIRINAVSQRESVGDLPTSPTESTSDHQFQIDAALVRILKRKKRLDKAQLIQEVSNELNFNVTNSDFNKRMPSLIEREYVGQDEDDQNIYIYLA